MRRSISIDGGGIRGIVALTILARLRQHRDALLDEADILAGTSTGGIIALLLARDLPLSTALELYTLHGHEIFSRRWAHYLGLTGARYGSRNLRRLLQENLGTKTLGELRKKVVIPAFDILGRNRKPPRWHAKVFHNFQDSEDNSVPAWSVAMATSAAPTYFKAYKGYVDGGLIANNPCMVALAQLADERHRPATSPEKMVMLSIGCGSARERLRDPDYDFGKLSVGTLVEILLTGTEDVPTYQARALLGGRFLRIDPLLDEDIPLDGVDRIDALLRIGMEWRLADAYRWLDTVWDQF
jgi:patatin-like phospholipase/acyl hydrolase